MMVSELGLDNYTWNRLCGEDIATTDVLCSLAPHDLLRVANLGRGTLRKIERALARHGLSLSDHPEKRPTPGEKQRQDRQLRERLCLERAAHERNARFARDMGWTTKSTQPAGQTAQAAKSEGGQADLGREGGK